MARRVLELGTQLAREKWRSSGITDEQADLLGFRPLTPEETAALGNNFEQVASLYIPYFDSRGNQTKFFRVRYLGPLPGFAGALTKQLRYMQEVKTLNEVYMPPLLNTDWEEVLNDASHTIFITEGELKAAAACIHGFATIGLGGVDMWRASKRGIDFLPTLEATSWRERGVYIVYDSDASEKPEVVGAELRLAHELINQGARVHIVSLPGAGSKKQGLDDFLLAQGKAAFETLIEAAGVFQEAAALWEMNAEVIYVEDPGFVVRRDTGQRISAGAFVQHAYADRHFMASRPTKKGPAIEAQKTASRWLEWEQRAKAARMTYAPGQLKITENREWNTWLGWGVEPKKGTILPWNWLLSYIFKEDHVARRWFEQWCAYPLRFPGTKLYTSAVLWSVHQGTGKTLLGRTLMRIYGTNSSEIESFDLKGTFNTWGVNKQFVLGEEIAGDDRRNISDRLKSLITQEEFHVKEKFIPEYYVPNCINYMFTSNHPDAFFLEDTDRRFFVHEIVGPPEAPPYYATYDTWFRGDGAAALFEHLLQLDLTGFDPKGPAPMTIAKQEMISDVKSDMGTWVRALRDDPTEALAGLGEVAARNAELLTNAQLLQAYDPAHDKRATANGLGRELKRGGFRTLPVVMTKKGSQRLYVIRNTEEWLKASPQKCAEHFEELFGKEKY